MAAKTWQNCMQTQTAMLLTASGLPNKYDSVILSHLLGMLKL